MEQQGPRRTNHPGSLVLIFGLFLLVGAGGAAFLYYKSDWRVPALMKKLNNPVAANKEAIGAGMMLYLDHCQSCHGENGDGKGEKAEKLSVAPANFTDGREMSSMADGELFWKITQGRRPMPGFRDTLTEQERWQLLVYIRTLAPKPNRGAPAQP